MVNAIRVASDFIASLPRTELTPEVTDGYDGFVHAYDVNAAVDRTVVKVLLRDFDTRQLAVLRELVETRAHAAVAAHPGASVEVNVQEQYRNMREVLDLHPDVIDKARVAMRRLGLEPVERPIRGGTDGSRLSFMGLPTPNLFAGEHNFHSRLEWVSRYDMDKAVEVIVNLCRLWAQRAPTAG
jgi:tripeptide aminopeptidase